MILQFPILISSLFKSTTKSLSFMEKKSYTSKDDT